MESVIKDASHVIIHHSDIELLKYTHKEQKVILYHAGTRFRSSHNAILNNSEGCNHLIALPEFKKYINAPYIVGAIDTDKIPFIDETKKPYIVGHYPSNPEVKGSSLIIDALKDVPGFSFSLSKVGYKSQLERISQCDIYVELFAPTQGGNEYGSFGMTALEASAMGKIVITQNKTGKELYKQTYGDCPLIIVDSIEELKQNVLTLIDKDVQEIKNLSSQFRRWAESQHGYKATGSRLYKFLHGL